jgi:hypothetical protein
MVTKFAVSVTEMAKMAGLSRARFYQLVKKGAFPMADKDQISGRSCYLAEKQQQILESRRKNCGIDGNPILFYSRRSDSGKPEIKSVSPKLQSKAITNILESLEALNVKISTEKLQSLLIESYPQGIDQIDPGEVVRTLFLRIKRQNSTDNLG